MKNASNFVKTSFFKAALVLSVVIFCQTNADAQSTKLKGTERHILVKDKSAKGINENKTQAKSSKKTPKDMAGDVDATNEVKYKRNTMSKKK